MRRAGSVRVAIIVSVLSGLGACGDDGGGVGDVDAGDAVDRSVMDLRDDGVRTLRHAGDVVQAFDDREFPQRL